MNVIRSPLSAPQSAPRKSNRNGKSQQRVESALGNGSGDSNGTDSQSRALRSPKTSNLIYTENGPQQQRRTTSKSASAENGRNSNYDSIPVQSREHNTRSKNGIRKEVHSVSH